MEQVVDTTGRGRRQLLLLIGLFLLPPIAAWLAWNYLSAHGVSATSNHGTLISPPRPVDLSGLAFAPEDGGEQLKGRWVYIVFTKGHCGTRCRRQLYLTRQVRIGVNKDMPRVRRLLVTRGGDPQALRAVLSEEHPDLIVAAVTPQGKGLLRPFRGEGFGFEGREFFLRDPLGNLMMYYRVEGNDLRQGKGLLRDLQKLLKVSQVG